MTSNVIDEIISKLDGYLYKNDYQAAKTYLTECQKTDNDKVWIFVTNELMGLHRKLGERDKAISYAEAATEKIDALGLADTVGGATTFLNTATVFKAFGESKKAISLFEKAKAVYESQLESTDTRLGGLYNNMGLALVDEGRYGEANELYLKAIPIMKDNPPECAVTYLNMASAEEARVGLADADEYINRCLDKAEQLLDGVKNRDGNYAFVCEKCASVFDYYGRFFYCNSLKERARRIYEGA